MTTAQFSTSVVDGRLVLAVHGEIDLSNVAEFEAALVELIERADGHPLVVDAEGLEYVDSTGIKALMRAQRRYVTGPKIEVRNPSPAVRRVLELTVPDMFDVL
jgi:anti-anti-sigma factor